MNFLRSYTMNKLSSIIVLLLLLSQCIPAQSKGQKFQVDFNEIKGELTSKDLFKKDFGRYDGYNIELFEGEAVNFVAYSKNFQPSIALVNSKGDIFKQSVRNDKGYANIVTEIPTKGHYILYVIGDEKATGNYTLQTAVADRNALSLSNNMDFCTSLDFLLSHATAYFFLLENPEFTKGPLIKPNGAIDAYIDEEAGSYNATFYTDNNAANAETVFKSIAEKVKDCLGTDWQITFANWQKNEDYREKSRTYTEKVKNSPRYIEIVMVDYTNSIEKYENNYSVVVEINRKH